MDAGADINKLDADKNSPLHVKCYGEQNEPTPIECIHLLVSRAYFENFVKTDAL